VFVSKEKKKIRNAVQVRFMGTGMRGAHDADKVIVGQLEQ
jgi:hypothetical protein